jgi:tripartite ATP-independent transporter DctM subunit
MNVDLTFAGYLGIASFLVLVFAGMRLALACLLVGTVGLGFVVGFEGTLKTIATACFSISSTYAYSVIPLFVIMGFLAHYAGFADQAFSCCKKWVGHLPGGLMSATVLGGAAFGAASGSSVAAAGVLTKVALPELDKAGYDRKMSIGCIVVTGTLAIMIPPSTTMVIYCLFVEQSIAKLLIAGIMPGLMSAFVLITYITVTAYFKPTAQIMPRASWGERINALKDMWGIASIGIVVMGGLYSGFFTPNEAAAAGTMFIFVVALLQRKLPWEKLKGSLLSSVETTCMILLIMIGVIIFSRFLALTQITYDISNAIVGLNISTLTFIIAVMALYFFLGCFLEPIGMMALTLPVLFPVVLKLGIDPIWFGILTIKMSEISIESPPVGMNLFVVNGLLPDVPIQDIWKGTFPFIAVEMINLTLLIMFPQISLFLTSYMK